MKIAIQGKYKLNIIRFNFEYVNIFFVKELCVIKSLNYAPSALLVSFSDFEIFFYFQNIQKFEKGRAGAGG